MNNYNHLKLALVSWVYANNMYKVSGNSSLQTLLIMISDLPKDTLEHFFGDIMPSREQVEIFYDKYHGMVAMISKHHFSILMGAISVDDVILEVVAKDTWL